MIKIMFWSAYGALFDPDEGGDSIKRKISDVIANKKPSNPYRAILNSSEVAGLEIKDCGELPIESWLSIYPEKEDLLFLTSTNFGAFLDSDGCREYRNRIRASTKDLERPLIVGIEHSLTGGVVEGILERVEDLTLVVLDSHFDGIPSPVRNGLIGYMMERRPDYERFGYRPSDYVFSSAGRKNSYNGGSFLYHLIDEGVIDASKVIVFGALDYPSEKMEGVQDLRVREFVQVYKGLEMDGARIVHRGIIDSLGAEEAMIRAMASKGINVYASIDLDIGSRAALMGAKFTDVEGLKEADIYNAARVLYRRNSTIAGMDLMEIDPWRAGADNDGVKDRTYNICGNIIRILSEGTIQLDNRYKGVLKGISNKTTIKEIKDKKVLNDLVNMGFLVVAGKYVKNIYDGKII